MNIYLSIDVRENLAAGDSCSYSSSYIVRTLYSSCSEEL